MTPAASKPPEQSPDPKPRMRLIPLDDTVVFPNMGITLTIDVGDDERVVLVPHHENEYAQSCAVTDKPLARYWLHNGFVTINDEKMSKSLKNYVSVADVLADHAPPVVRTALVAPHYRSAPDHSRLNNWSTRGNYNPFTAKRGSTDPVRTCRRRK